MRHYFWSLKEITKTFDFVKDRVYIHLIYPKSLSVYWSNREDGCIFNPIYPSFLLIILRGGL